MGNGVNRMKIKVTIISMILSLLIVSVAYTAEAAMSYNEALKYQSLHAKEVFIFNEKVKDIYGEKNVCRYFNLLGKDGVGHNGNAFAADRSFINFLVNYGFENIPQEPFAYFRWWGDLDGHPDKGYEPKTFNISFKDGFVKTFAIQGWEYKRQNLGFGNWSHTYDGRIRLTEVELYELYTHGDVMSVSIDKGAGRIKNFFYMGEKDVEEKAELTKGIAHAVKILQIDEDTIEAKRAEMEQQRLQKLREEIEKELKEEAEREAMKKAILEEMKAKNTGN